MASGQCCVKLQSQLRTVAHTWQDLKGVMIMEPLLEALAGLQFLRGQAEDHRILSGGFRKQPCSLWLEMMTADTEVSLGVFLLFGKNFFTLQTILINFINC